MERKLLVLCAEDRDYVERFAAYLQRRARLPHRVRSFHEAEKLLSFLETDRPDLLLISPELSGCVEDLSLPSVMLWAEEDGGTDGELYRYQPMSACLRQLLARMEADALSERESAAVRMKLWGVYSPSRSSGQTTAALLLGQFLAEREPALYLNLERISGFASLMQGGERGNLSDLLYLHRTGADLRRGLSEMVDYLGSLAWLMPVCRREDLRLLTEQEWQGLLRAIGDTGLYRHLILDIGDGPCDERLLLRACDRILMTVREDKVSRAKVEEWLEYLKASGEEHILRRIRQVKLLPLGREEAFSDYRELRLGAWGQTIQNYLREGGA